VPLAEVVEHYHFAEDEIIVNVRGDDRLIDPAHISQVAHDLASHPGDVATLVTTIENKEMMFGPNIVKVVLDANGYALYFSHAAIPWDRDGITDQLEGHSGLMLRHIGIYAYRAGL